MAIENLQAAFVGYANEEKSYTQKFNCHKVVKHDLGRVVKLYEVHDQVQPRSEFFKAIWEAVQEQGLQRLKTKFYYHLLHDDERPSQVDLEYWLDYVYLFGVRDRIPLYDKMSFITYRNWDMYVASVVLVFLLFKILRATCYWCFKDSSKQEDKVKKD